MKPIYEKMASHNKNPNIILTKANGHVAYDIA